MEQFQRNIYLIYYHFRVGEFSNISKFKISGESLVCFTKSICIYFISKKTVKLSELSCPVKVSYVYGEKVIYSTEVKSNLLNDIHSKPLERDVNINHINSKPLERDVNINDISSKPLKRDVNINDINSKPLERDVNINDINSKPLERDVNINDINSKPLERDVNIR